MDILDFNSWALYKGAAEGSGRSEKSWLQKNGQTGLFKYPKSEFTTEHVSEKIAFLLCELLNIPCAHVDIGSFNGRIGSMGYNIINAQQESLLEGIWFISKMYKDFNPGALYCEKSKKYYSIGMIQRVIKFVDSYNIEQQYLTSSLIDVLKMMVFDALIGNSDRHQSNWAYIFDTKADLFKFAPLYDNGSSLCSYVLEDAVDDILRDVRRFDALVGSKSRTKIRVNEDSKKAPTHDEMLNHIKSNFYDDIIPFIENIYNKISNDSIAPILEAFPDPILSPKKKKLINLFILAKKEHICNSFICREANE